MTRDSDYDISSCPFETGPHATKQICCCDSQAFVFGASSMMSACTVSISAAQQAVDATLLVVGTLKT